MPPVGRELSFVVKKKLLVDFDALPKVPMSEAVSKLVVPRTTLITLLQSRENLQRAKDDTRTRQRYGKERYVDNAVIQGIASARERNLSVSGPLVQEKPLNSQRNLA